MTAATGEDPRVLANYRFARGAVIILTALIVIAIGALVLGFATRGGGKHAAAAGAAEEVRNVTLPNGSHIVSVDVQQDRLIVRTRAYEGEEIDIIDTHDGRLVARIGVPVAAEEKPRR